MESRRRVKRSIASVLRFAPSSKGIAMYFRKVERLWKGSALRNASKEPKSSSRFCMGVPVKHQRDLASKLATVR
jgi:hypothetical protein